MTSPTHPDTPLDLDAILLPGARLSFKGYGTVHGKNYPSTAPWSEFCELYGFELSERVTKTKTDALITDEPDNTNGKEAQAREFGKPIIPMDVFTNWVESHLVGDAVTQDPQDMPGPQEPEHAAPESQPAQNLPENPYSLDPSGRAVSKPQEHKPQTPKPQAPGADAPTRPEQPPAHRRDNATHPVPQGTPALHAQQQQPPSLTSWFIAAGVMFVIAAVLVGVGLGYGVMGSILVGGTALFAGVAAAGSMLTLIVIGILAALRR